MAPTARSCLLVLFAACSWAQLTAGSTLYRPSGTSMEQPPKDDPRPIEQRARPLPGLSVPVDPALLGQPKVPTSPAAALQKMDLDDLVEDVHDLIEDPAFLEELLKNINDTSEEDVSDDRDDSANDDDTTDDKDDSDVSDDKGEDVSDDVDDDVKSVDADGDDRSSKEDKDDVDIYEVLHADSKESADTDDDETSGGKSKEHDDDDGHVHGNAASSSGGVSSGMPRDYHGNDLFDILIGHQDTDDTWKRAQLAKSWNNGAMSGQCPVYPVRIDNTQITIDTQDGCKIVIELSGQTVKKVGTMANGSFQLKSTKVSFLMGDDNKNSHEDVDDIHDASYDADDKELADDDSHDKKSNENEDTDDSKADDSKASPEVTNDRHSDKSVENDDTHEREITDDLHDDTNSGLNNDSTATDNNKSVTATDDMADDIGDDINIPNSHTTDDAAPVV